MKAKLTMFIAALATAAVAVAALALPVAASGGGANPDHTVVINGADRYATAAQIALDTGADLGSAHTIYIANGESLVDAVVIGATTDEADRKLLLVKRDEVPAVTAETLQQIQHAKLVFLGGEEVISPKVREEVMSLTDNYAYPN